MESTASPTALNALLLAAFLVSDMYGSSSRSPKASLSSSSSITAAAEDASSSMDSLREEKLLCKDTDLQA